jgi:hypothetical protein
MKRYFNPDLKVWQSLTSNRQEVRIITGRLCVERYLVISRC